MKKRTLVVTGLIIFLVGIVLAVPIITRFFNCFGLDNCQWTWSINTTIGLIVGVILLVVGVLFVRQGIMKKD